MTKKCILKHTLTLLTGVLLVYAILLRNQLAFSSADQTSIAYLYRDLILHHGSLSHWMFSSVPYFFPDVTLLFLVSFFADNFRIAMQLTDVVFLIIYYFEFIAIGKLVCGEDNKDFFGLCALLSLFLACGHLSEKELFNPILTSHFGSTLLMYLTGLWIILHLFIKNKKRVYYLALSFISFATTYSDPLFLPVFCGSVFFGLIISYRHSTQNIATLLKIICATAIPACVGFFLNELNLLPQFLTIESAFFTGAPSSSPYFNMTPVLHLKQTFSALFQDNMGIVFLLFAFFMIESAIIVELIRKKKSHYSFNAIFMLTFIFGSMLIIIFSVFSDPDMKNMSGFTGLRHYYPLIITPIFLGFPTIVGLNTNFGIFIRDYYAFFMLSICLSLLLFFPWQPLDKLAYSYPADVACLDNYIKNGELPSQNGVSYYWNAHPSNLTSKENLNLVAVTPEMKPYDWASTSEDYVNKQFYFAFFEKGSAEGNNVITKLGKPNKILICPKAPKYLVYVYNKGFTVSK